MENEKFVSRYRQLLELCRHLVHVKHVDESEEYTKKVERLWRIDD
jgi:hypothetical protein